MTSPLSDQELATYARRIALDSIGYDGQLALRRARVCLVGLGGLGALMAAKLPGMGVGFLRLLDRDVVCRPDLHRQVLYDLDQAGLAKAEAAAVELARLNPDVNLELVAESLVPANARRRQEIPPNPGRALGNHPGKRPRPHSQPQRLGRRGGAAPAQR